MTISNEEVFVTRARRPSVSSVPPSVPPGAEESWCEELAHAVMARNRGIASEPSWASRIASGIARGLLRLVAPVIGLVTGAWLGLFFAPFTLGLGVSLPKRLLAFLFAVPGGALAGGYLGLRFAGTGKLIDLLRSRASCTSTFRSSRCPRPFGITCSGS